jgi:hypothetical protein
MESKHLVIGYGEIGKPIYNILYGHYETEKYDKAFNVENPSFVSKFDVLHIAFGHKESEVEDFKRWVRDYRARFLKEGGLTIIHSTVAIGVSEDLDAVHSPVLGIHPHLEESIKTFTKFFSGNRAGEAAEVFRRCGIKTYIFDKSDTTELMKILDTTFYGLCIEYTKEVKRLSEQFGVPFEAWTIWTDVYNKGYQKLGYSEYTRPNLVPIMKKIGGHCVLNNSTLLHNKFTKFLLDNNA